MNQTIQFTHRGAGGTISKTQVIAGDAEARQIEPFASDAAALHLHVNIPAVSRTKALSICADQDCTVKFNDTGGTQGTIALKANVPWFWFYGAPWTLASILGFAGSPVDITDIYLTNNSGPAAAGTLSIITLTTSL
jgi:hypothetical protein